jgi:lambda family phage portal protein
MAAPKFKTTALDRALLAIAPKWALARMQSRAAAIVLARNYEAAAGGRRTQNWGRQVSDANAAAGPALASLRALSRDLLRNNAWARNGRRVITRNVVGWGITPKALAGPAALSQAWKKWAGSTQCDAAGRLTFSGLQKLAMSSIFDGGEVLIRRRWRRPDDGFALPMQLQVLEPDHLDTSRNNVQGTQGGMVYYGIEYDAIGRRVAYWLFDQHPGAAVSLGAVSRRIPASEVIHAFDLERAGQERGVPWLAAAIGNLRDFDEFEDAELMKQKIAACMTMFVTDVDGTGTGIAEPSTGTDDPLVETMEPGMVIYGKPGQDVKFGVPPPATDLGFSARTLRRIAAAIGITYEDQTGDYSQVNFSSSRMARIAHWGNVYDWQWNLMIPQVCVPAWEWAMEAAVFAGIISSTAELPGAEWTPTPMAMTDPDKEARANVVMVRSGQKTLSQVIREQGGDPEAQLEEYAEDLAKLDAKGIILDIDARKVTQAGLTQQVAKPSGSGGAADPGAAAMEDPAAMDAADAADAAAAGKDMKKAARGAPPVIVNVMPDQAEAIGARVAEAMRAQAGQTKTVILQHDDKGRLTGATVSQET